MLLSIDAIGKRYSVLPSEVLDRASTFDLVVIDAALGYEKYITDKAEGKREAPKLSQDEMTKMLERTKKRNGNTN